MNAGPRSIDAALKILEVEGAVGVASGTKRQVFFRTPNPWQPDLERIARVTNLAGPSGTRWPRMSATRAA